MSSYTDRIIRPIRQKSDALLFAIDLIGTFVFAVEGAMAAIEGKLDLLGLRLRMAGVWLHWNLPTAAKPYLRGKIEDFSA